MFEEGARIVSVRSYFSRIGIRTEAYGNYDLHFSMSGLLLQSFHMEQRKNFEIDYSYDTKDNLIKAEQRNPITKELEEISEFTYDEQGRILTEKCRAFYPKLIVKIATATTIYKYKDLSEIVVTTSDYDDQYTTYYTYNLNKQLIEQKSYYKREGLHEWIRYEYDKNGNQIRLIHIDEKGELYLSYEFYPDKNGLCLGYKCISIDSNYTREYIYKFNDRGHWKTETRLDDGLPRTICERIIEYY
jgi:hypothetical protein